MSEEGKELPRRVMHKIAFRRMLSLLSAANDDAKVVYKLA